MSKQYRFNQSSILIDIISSQGNIYSFSYEVKTLNLAKDDNVYENSLLIGFGKELHKWYV